MRRPNRAYKALVSGPRIARVAAGLLLVAAGLVGFLPVLGYWMIPLGLAVIFFDVPWVRRTWKRARLWWKSRRASS